MEFKDIYMYNKNDKVSINKYNGFIQSHNVDGTYTVICDEKSITVDDKSLLKPQNIETIIHIKGNYYDDIVSGKWFYIDDESYNIELNIKSETGYFMNTSNEKMDLIVDISINDNIITGSYYGVCGVSTLYGKIIDFQFMAYVIGFSPLNDEQVKNLGFVDINDYNNFLKLKFKNVSDYNDFKASGLSKFKYTKFKKSGFCNLEDYLKEEKEKFDNLMMVNRKHRITSSVPEYPPGSIHKDGGLAYTNGKPIRNKKQKKDIKKKQKEKCLMVSTSEKSVDESFNFLKSYQINEMLNKLLLMELNAVNEKDYMMAQRCKEFQVKIEGYRDCINSLILKRMYKEAYEYQIKMNKFFTSIV